MKQLKKASTIEDLEDLEIGSVYCDISHRGGGLGFYSEDVASHFEVERFYLPPKFGAGCNYLGGGLRGSIFASTFSDKITGRKAELLKELASACVRAYKNAENESGLNDEEDSDGETNWEALGTRMSRDAGIESACQL